VATSPPAGHRSGSRYPGAAPSPDESKIEQARWLAVDDLQAAHRLWISNGAQDLPDGRDLHLTPAEGPDTVMVGLLRQEATRIFHGKGGSTDKKTQADRDTLIDASIQPLVWAEHYCKERNPEVLARFAVETAYDNTFRMQVAGTLTLPAPTWWLWAPPANGGPSRLTWAPMTDGYTLPIHPRDFGRLEGSTARFTADVIEERNLVSPFQWLRPTYTWAMDPLRPPVQAVRTAASIILQDMPEAQLGMPVGLFTFGELGGDPPAPVLAVEMGHSAAPEALAVFTKGRRIYTTSSIFGQGLADGRPDKFTSVVVNIPHAAGMAFVTNILHRENNNLPVMNRMENDIYWRWPSEDQGDHCEPLVRYGLDHLSPGGIMVILTDTFSGQLHLARKVIQDDGRMVQIPIRPQGPMAVSYGYDKKPWGVYGCLRPTGRVLTAWRMAK
jgi:hypothetical protein